MGIRSLKRNLESLVKGLAIAIPLTIVALTFANKADARTICVGNPSAPCDTTCASIQEGINSAIDGDTVLVANGTYDQGIIPINWDNKDIVLRGEDSDSTIIRGSGNEIIKIDKVTNNAIVENLTINLYGGPSSTRKGIHVLNTSDPLNPNYFGPKMQNLTLFTSTSQRDGKGIFVDAIGDDILNPLILSCRITGFLNGVEGSGNSLTSIQGCEFNNNEYAIKMMSAKAIIGSQEGVLARTNSGSNIIYGNVFGAGISYSTIDCSDFYGNYLYDNSSADIKVVSDCNPVLEGNTFGSPPPSVPPLEERIFNTTSSSNALLTSRASNNIDITNNNFPQSVIDQMAQGQPCENNIPEFLDGCDIGYGPGIFTWTVTSVPEYKSSFSLSIKNYPNPFNPYTNIDYELPKDGDVDVGIYDIAGRLTKNLYEGNRKAGKYSLIWDGKDNSGNEMSSGVYFCRIKFNNKEVSNKLVLVR